MVFEPLLSGWPSALTNAEKHELEKRHLQVLASLRFVQLDYDFLYAVVNFWDVTHDCFYFGNHELGILPEEFGAIIDWPCSKVSCVPSFDDYFF